MENHQHFASTDADEGNIDNLRATLRAANFGELMSVLLQSEHHRGVTLGTLSRQLVPAFLSDQYVLARAVPDSPGAPGTPIGFAIWASVSDDVAARVLADGARSVRLAPQEWTSGNNVIILDIVAAPVVAKEIMKKIGEKVGLEKKISVLTGLEDGSLQLKPWKRSTRAGVGMSQ